MAIESGQGLHCRAEASVKRRLLQKSFGFVNAARWRLAAVYLLGTSLSVTASPALSASDPVGDLRRLGDGFSHVYRNAAPSVVHIRSHIASPAARADETNETAIPNIAEGSGVVFQPAAAANLDRHFILTNHHVIDRAIRTTVRLADGREFEASIAGSDPKTDIAVIEIAASGLKPLPMTDSDRVEIGQWVLAIGSPFGLKHSLSAGIVSGTGRTNIGINAYENYIQTDAAIGPGNSGGPLINLDGEIVGIISSIFAYRDGVAGAGFAIPINLALAVANQLVANGEVDRAYLGVFLQSLTDSLARAFGTPNTQGALISQVAPDSPASEAGLRVGDIVIQYRGQAVRDAGSFINDLSMTTPNSQVTLTILRDKRRQTRTVTLAARRSFEHTNTEVKTAPSVSLLGMTLSPVTQASAERHKLSDPNAWIGNRLIVSAITPGSSAARSGIEPGNILMQISGQTVSSVDEFNHSVQANQDKEHLLLLIRQGNTQEFIALERN